MKYKLLIINIISFVIVYQIVFEYLSTYVYNFDKIYTPLGRFIRECIFKEQISHMKIIPELCIFIFSLFIGGILLYVANRWYGKESVIITFVREFFTFAIINILVLITLLICFGIDPRAFFIYIVYFICPMSIMLMLLLPIFWVNKKISISFSRFNKKAKK